MALAMIAKTILPVVAVLLAEQYVIVEKFPVLYQASNFFSVVRGFSLVIAVNVVATSFIMITLGMFVSGARTKYKEKALKDGDKDAEERYSYPKLYAEGFSEHAKAFNCVQRGHQQALETYTQFVVLSLIGGLRFPVTVTIGGIIWSLARLKWAEGYATGTPSRRYDNFLASGIWSSLIMVMVCAIGTAGSIAGLI